MIKNIQRKVKSHSLCPHVVARHISIPAWLKGYNPIVVGAANVVA